MIPCLVQVIANTTLFEEDLWDAADENQQLYKREHPTPLRAELPENFTWNTSDCVHLNLKDQGSCGSCWAASTAAALGMRRCIKLGDRSLISIQEFVGCDHTSMYGVTNNGCYGGHPLPAMQYGYSTGATVETCYKYTANSVTYPYPTIPCQTKCDNSASKPRLMNTAPRRLIGEAAMMEEIYNNGPITASYMIYADFENQTKNDGIFIKKSTVQWGGHAIIIIGWGVRNGVKYWQAQNTWGKNWYNGGYFKIRRGTNEATIESAAAASNPIGTGSSNDTNVTTPGSFIFDNVWITQKTVSIQYQNMTSCTLKIGSATVGTISGSGTTNYALTLATGQYAVTCGTVSRTVTVIAYTPKFNATSFTGTVSGGIRVNFTSQSGITQVISYGTYSASTTAAYADLFPPVGTYTVTLKTVGTNPTLSATTSVTVTSDPVVDKRVLTIVVQPKAGTVGTPVTASAQAQYIERLTIRVLNSTGAVLQQTTWTPTTNIQYASIATATFIPTTSGTIYFQFADNDLSVNTFSVAITGTTTVTEITQPTNGQLVIFGNTITIKTTGLDGQRVLLNGTSLGTISSGQLSWKVSSTPGDYQLIIGTANCLITVVPQPVFSASKYTFDTGTTNTITINTTNNVMFDALATVTMAGSELKINKNVISVSSAIAKTVTITLTLLDSLPAYSTTATVVFSTPPVTTCTMALETKEHYIYGYNYAIKTTCPAPYTIYSPSGSTTTATAVFKPAVTGNHRICSGQTCTSVIFIEGLEITSAIASPSTLSDTVTVKWNITSAYTGKLALQYFCKDTGEAVDFFLVDAQASTTTFKIPQRVACKEAAFRLRSTSTPYVYGDIFFTLKRTELASTISSTPFQRDPAMDLVIGGPNGSINETVPDKNDTTPDKNETEPTPPTDSAFEGYYPNDTVLLSKQTVTLLWVTNLTATNNVTILLYSGRPGTQKLVQTITTTAKNNGSYTVTLPTLATGEYYFLLRTVEGGMIKYTTYLYFTIGSSLKMDVKQTLMGYSVKLNDLASIFIVDQDGMRVETIGTGDHARVKLPKNGLYRIRACQNANCVESDLLERK